MKITKLGHCCLLIETRGKRILTDPGGYSIEEHAGISNLDFILYTHEHQDHFHLESLRDLLVDSPKAQVYANTGVGALLAAENIECRIVQDGETLDMGGIVLTGIGSKHAVIHDELPLPANTGFFIDERLWYPGDAFTDPKKEVEILALPVAGPWVRLSEAIDYALRLQPKTVFPVHDGMLRDDRIGPAHAVPAKVLGDHGIEFVPMVAGDFLEKPE